MNINYLGLEFDFNLLLINFLKNNLKIKNGYSTKK